MNTFFTYKTKNTIYIDDFHNAQIKKKNSLFPKQHYIFTTLYFYNRVIILYLNLV